MRVELRGIEKRFGAVQANQDISLTVEAGSIHGLLGENGAGKSTLVKILSGFLRRDRGQISLNGQPVQLKTPSEAMDCGIGMLHQDPLDFPPLTVLDNFMVGSTRSWLLNPRQARQQLQTLAQQLGFELDPERRVDRLSVGERQQLEIVRLLALGVQTLILDEPTTGISANQKQALFAAAKQLATQGKSVIFVSHKLEDVNALCDRVTVMRQGQVVGHRPIPCPDSDLLALIFGRELAVPAKPNTCQTQPLLDLRHVSVNHDRLWLQIPDFTLHQGEVVGLAGLEGNGQQPFLQLCAGLLKPKTGEIQLQGIDLAGMPYASFRHAGIGYSPADRLQDGLVRGLSIQDHVALRHSTILRTRRTLKLWHPIRWRSVHEQTQTAIAQFNIRGTPHSRVEALSGGNQQRTQLALLPVPLNLLLMEHPTRGLDIESTHWVWQQLLARCAGGSSIIFMSADLDELMRYSDRIMVFSGGQLSPPLPTASLTIERLGRLMSGQLS